jgi:hypothetical protein
VQTLTIPASGSSVPTSVDQSSMAKSWNVKIGGHDPARPPNPGRCGSDERDTRIERAEQQFSDERIAGGASDLGIATLPHSIRADGPGGKRPDRSNHRLEH